MTSINLASSLDILRAAEIAYDTNVYYYTFICEFIWIWNKHKLSVKIALVVNLFIVLMLLVFVQTEPKQVKKWNHCLDQVHQQMNKIISF
jgi:hypothetical protein